MSNIYNTVGANCAIYTKEVFLVAGTPQQKQKTLLLLRILCERTDEQHAMTLSELEDALSQMGISSERKSLYRDLKAISDAGFTVGTIRSKDTRYYWADRPFGRNDIILLSNLLRISPSIPRKRKPEIEKKLRGLTAVPCQTDAFVNLLSAIPDGSVTERVYSRVELLFDGILSGRKVRFYYKGAVMREQSRRRQMSHYQTVSPYRLVWSDGYYLVAADEEGNLAFYRVDRMEELKVTSQSAIDIREIGGDLDFDLGQYIKGYFASLEDSIHMIFRVSEGFLSGAERFFPSDSLIEPAADGSYFLTCDIPADESLFGWLLLHSEDIRLLYPESLTARLRELSGTAVLTYGTSDEAKTGINYEESGNTVDKLPNLSYN